MRINSWSYFFFILLAMLTQTACQQNLSPSILVIAIEGLPVGEVQCNDEFISKPKSGLAEICKNSVRFTHFFTSSTLSLPAMTSLLTGLYPFQTGVRSNQDYLRPETLTLSEVAYTKHYHTAFFSGGPSILRKSNLQQGFEIFDDHFTLTNQKIHRPFSKNTELFKSWLKQDVGANPFFSVLYIPDLIFQAMPKVPEAGEIKTIVAASSLDEIDENLYNIIESLKERKIWNSSYVVLVGLNGDGVTDRKDEVASMNLHSENIQTALFIKPPFRARDDGVSWKIDSNYSMADLGYTLLRILEPLRDEVSKDSLNTPFPIVAFNDQIVKNSPTPDRKKPIAVETYFKDLIRYAIVNEHVLFLEKENWTSFNTLVDRLELNSIPAAETESYREIKTAIAFLSRQRAFAWTHPSPANLRLFLIPQSNWVNPNEATLLRAQLERLLTKTPQSEFIRDLLVTMAFDRKNWNDVLSLTKNSTKWLLLKEIANINLKNTASPLLHPCLMVLQRSRVANEEIRECDDTQLQLLLSIHFSEELGLNREFLLKKLERTLQNINTDSWVAKNNMALGEIWKLNPTAQMTAQPIEIMLLHPLLAKFRNISN